MDWESLLRHPILTTLLQQLASISPAQWCQTFYLLAASCVLLIAATPAEARTLLMNYGARQSSSPAEGGGGVQKKENNAFISLIATLTSHGQVPHSWFSVFYTVSVACSLFWLAQYLTHGSVLQGIASRQEGSSVSATLGQVGVAWTMMCLQGARRVYEHAVIVKASSKSTMWFVHWLLGLFFYVLTNVAVWVEGSGAILNRQESQKVDSSSSSSIGPLVKISIAVPAFLFAWVNQYRCHEHLAQLKKYSLPDRGLFRRLVCPHYTCECLLYLSIAVAAAPKGQWCNRTLLCALVFVLVNLGVTASGTRKWYIDKFGARVVAEKWNMIPFIF